MQQNGEIPEYDRKYTTGVMVILASLVLVVMYVEGMLTPSLPTIAHDFHVTISQVSLVLSVYLVTGAALSPIVGKLGDLYGKKRMMTIVLVIYLAAVFSTGFSPNFTYMLISRMVQGVGLTVMPLGMSLVREEFPREIIPKAQAIISAMFGAGFAVSLPLGAFVSDQLSWRWTYHTAVPLVVGLFIVTLYFIRESNYRRPGTKIDFAGAGMLAVSLSLLVFGLSYGPVYGWNSLTVRLLFLLGSFLLVPTAIYEIIYSRKGKEAIIDPKLLSARNVWIPNLVVAITGFGMFLAFQALTFRFEMPKPYGFGLSILDTGLSLVAFASGIIIFGPLTGIIITNHGAKKMAVLGPIIGAVGFLLESSNPQWSLTLFYVFIAGTGMAITQATIINFLVLSVDPKHMGLATSMNGTFRSLGSSIGAPLAGALMSTYTTGIVIGGQVIPSNHAYSLAFIIAVVTWIIGAAITVFAREVIVPPRGAKIRKRRREPTDFSEEAV